jgi:hypothetical protein
VTATTFYGALAGANTGSFSNLYSANALSTTNLFANTLTLANATSTINVLGSVTATTFYGALAGANTGAFSNLYSANALSTTNVFVSNGLDVGPGTLGTNVVVFSNVSGGSNVFVMDSNGRVGIGTTGPGYTLDIGQFGSSTYTLRLAAASTTSGTMGTSIRMMEANDTYGFSFQNLSASRLGIFRHSASSTGTEILTIIRDTNNIGVNVTTPTTYTLQVGGTIGSTGDITAFTSDERLKSKTGPVTDALDKVCTLDTFTYTHNDLARSFGFTDNRQYVGISAQQVRKVQPEVVRIAPFDADGEKSKSGEDYITVQYERLVPLLIEALKEERKAREALEARVKLLEQK